MFKAAGLLFVFLSMRAYASSLEVSVNDLDKNPVSEAVVFLSNDALIAAPPEQTLSIVDQIDKEFVNRVTVVRTGTWVSFPNHDQIRHHIYSFSPAKTFEIPLYKDVTPKPVLFDKSGAVVLGCNIHDWMKGYIYVAPTPYFAKTSESGQARIDIPPGKYTLNIWHPRLKTADALQVKTVTLADGETIKETLSLDLKPDLHVQRAPAGGGMFEGSYR